MSCKHPQKYRHASKAAAVAHIQSLEDHGKGSPDMSPYRCRDNDGTFHWHVGHDFQKFTNRIRRSIAGGRNPKSTYRRRTS